MQYVFKVGMHVIWRDVDPESEDMEMYRKNLAFLVAGISVVPINLPGFHFHKALKVLPSSERVTWMAFEVCYHVTLMVAFWMIRPGR